MRTFAAKKKAAQQTPSAKPTIPNEVGLASTASPRFAHDFSRIPVHPPAAGAVQTKLVINKPGDEYEQEAEQLSDRVLRMESPGEALTAGVVPQSKGELLPFAGRPLDAQGAQNDANIDSKIATLLVGRAGDLWVAQRIRQGWLGTTAGARPVEAHFIQGTTNRKALVIAGVHGSERQGIEVARMLLADLAVNQPIFTVIVVPSLFPDNAATGTREGSTPTNRNFPPANEDLAAATAAGWGTAVDAFTRRAGGARTRAILPENIMLLQLIERFGPERIISIHGTRHSGAGGVFYDPVNPTPAEVARARRDAQAMAYMQVPVEDQWTFEGQERLRRAEERNFISAIYAMTHRDRATALAAAAQIDAATTGVTGRERRPMEREGETTVAPAERARRRAHPSVPGNVGPSGNIDTAFWSGSVPGGVSLGGYAAQRGISVFTVEPPLNLRTTDYPSSLDAQVDTAERRVELQAYSDAVRTILLGR